MKAIVTRPAADAPAWVEGLQALGVQAQALPLIEIQPVPDPAPLQAVWRQLEHFAALMFVSGNAVEHFFASKTAVVPVRSSQFATKDIAFPRCWATGPGTARALQAHGVQPALIDAPAADSGRFDSEALWALVSSQTGWPGKTVLLVRGVDDEQGSTGRLWLEEQLQAAGAATQTVLAYRRGIPAWTESQLQRIESAASDGSVWVFSSSQAVAHLQRSVGTSWAAARAVATHPRIVQAAREAGFGVVCESRPQLDEVARSIKSLHD